MPVVNRDWAMTDCKLGSTDVDSLFLGDKLIWSRKNCKLTVIIHPSNATLTLTCAGYTQVDNYIIAPYGSYVSIRATEPTGNYYTLTTGKPLTNLDKTIHVYMQHCWSWAGYQEGGETKLKLTRYNNTSAQTLIFPSQLEIED